MAFLSEKRALRCFLAWVVLLFACDLFTLRSFPVPWADEEMFVDPAASLVLQGHWASTLWFSPADVHYWSGNMPAYSFLLAGWLRIWGFGEAAARSFNCFVFAITLVCTWFSVRKLKLIEVPAARLIILAALSVCYPVSYCVRCGRPDVIGMLIFSAGALCWGFERNRAACAGLFVCTLLIPFAGLQYAFFMPVLLAMLFWAGGKPALPRLYAILAGGLAGGLLLIAYYQFITGWDGLLASMDYIHSRHSQTLAENVLRFLREEMRYYLGRPHFALLMAAGFWLALNWRSMRRESRRRLLSGLVMLFFPGLCIGLFAHFMAPYHWLAAVPAMILLGSAACLSWDHFNRPTRVVLGLITVGLAISGRAVFLAIGIGAHTAGYVAQIESSALPFVHPGDSVFADPQLYYGLKTKVQRMYYVQLLPKLSEQEKAAVTVAFIHAGKTDPDEELFFSTFGNHWAHVADLPAPGVQSYDQTLFGKTLWWFHAYLFIGSPVSVYVRIPETTGAMAKK